MGSKTRTRNWIQRAVVKLLVKTVQGAELDEREQKFVLRHLPRHRCPGCGTGGHRRTAPIMQGPGGVRYRSVGA